MDEVNVEVVQVNLPPPPRRKTGEEGQLEMAIPAAPFVPVNEVFRSQVSICTGTTVIGQGCHVRIGSESFLLTASHVLGAARGMVDLKVVSSSGRAFELDRAWTLQYYSQNLDIVLMEVPVSMWSRIQVPAAKVGLPSVGSVVTVFSPPRAEEITPRRSVGCVVHGKPAFELRYQASTEAGTSGAPLLSTSFAGTKVIGVHLRADYARNQNVGVSLEPLLLVLGRKESTPPLRSRTYEEDFHLFDVPDEDLEEIDIYADGVTWKMGRATKRIQFRRDAEYLAGRVSWADMVEDEEMLGESFSRGPVASPPPVPKPLVGSKRKVQFPTEEKSDAGTISKPSLVPGFSGAVSVSEIHAEILGTSSSQDSQPVEPSLRQPLEVPSLPEKPKRLRRRGKQSRSLESGPGLTAERGRSGSPSSTRLGEDGLEKSRAAELKNVYSLLQSLDTHALRALKLGLTSSPRSSYSGSESS